MRKERRGVFFFPLDLILLHTNMYEAVEEFSIRSRIVAEEHDFPNLLRSCFGFLSFFSVHII